MDDTRVLQLEAVHNFRDYGHYPVTDGGRLRSGMLWRSEHHASATPADLIRIADIGFATVIDLRGLKERAKHPCRRPEGFAAEVLFHEGETAGMPPHLQAQIGLIDSPGIYETVVQVYRKLPMREALLTMLARYFAVLAQRDGPSLVHCFAGKDRTGIAVALFHKALGVHDDDIMEDFLLTNTAGEPEARIAAAAPFVRKRYGEISDEALHTILSVAPEYLENAFDAIAEAYGSMDRFLTTVLGVDDEMRHRLQEKYVIV